MILKQVLVIITSGVFLLPFQTVMARRPISVSVPDPHKIREYTIRENDSITYTLKLAYDAADTPLYFFRNVFTPVCFTNECKPVYIDLYWDLLGNYIRYEVPEREPLTKVEHQEFSEDDYEHLHRILSNPESILKQFTIYELVDTSTYHLSDSVDAVTGATPKTIKKEVIGGAVYTCYTIWYIVHGQVVNEIKQITDQHCNDQMLRRFLGSDNHHYQYWAIDKVIGEDGKVNKPFLKDVLQIIPGKNIFTALYALQKLPRGFLSPSDTIQTWLWSVYKSSHYSLQMAVLEKLEGVAFSDTLLLKISEGLSSANEEQFVRMLSLLTVQSEVPEKVILNLSRHLDSRNPVYAKGSYEALTKLPVKNGAIKKQLKEFERSNLNSQTR